MICNFILNTLHATFYPNLSAAVIFSVVSPHICGLQQTIYYHQTNNLSIWAQKSSGCSFPVKITSQSPCTSMHILFLHIFFLHYSNTEALLWVECQGHCLECLVVDVTLLAWCCNNTVM